MAAGEADVVEVGEVVATTKEITEEMATDIIENVNGMKMAREIEIPACTTLEGADVYSSSQ